LEVMLPQHQFDHSHPPSGVSNITQTYPSAFSYVFIPSKRASLPLFYMAAVVRKSTGLPSITTQLNEVLYTLSKGMHSRPIVEQSFFNTGKAIRPSPHTNRMACTAESCIQLSPPVATCRIGSLMSGNMDGSSHALPSHHPSLSQALQDERYKM